MLNEMEARQIKTPSRYKKKVSGVYKLFEHPEFCPAGIHKSPARLGETLRSGLPAGEGRYKKYCDLCGIIYYDIIKERS